MCVCVCVCVCIDMYVYVMTYTDVKCAVSAGLSGTRRQYLRRHVIR